MPAIRRRALGWVLLLVALQYGCAAQPRYGGPYPIAREALADKIAEFDAFRASRIAWGSSKVALLSRALFERSIQANRARGAPYGAAYQRYNYVIRDGEIRVAVWTVDGSLDEVCKQAPRPASAYTGVRVQSATMVDFFAEDTSLPSRAMAPLAARRACESVTPAGRAVGVLDAHSKHFLLVQGPDTRLDEYRPDRGSGDAWAKQEADYAGEIVVDVRGCYYLINQGSGTYRPAGGRNGDFRHLLSAARLFEEVLGTAPAAVWDISTPRIVPTTAVPPASAVAPRALECGGSG